ncbi:hypothetical protein Patl1_32955 [Pistacia atlantica]|uniref:Uncharacterized protein n=1 Tax=Pistacia atlantica TaxID=434234 RepID=A0ACC1ARW0_9ROSI|nr:hypothetical protein Patl1_32955 [Pistacia atlantica]
MATLATWECLLDMKQTYPKPYGQGFLRGRHCHVCV